MKNLPTFNKFNESDESVITDLTDAYLNYFR
jgi:hypothetical protein